MLVVTPFRIVETRLAVSLLKGISLIFRLPEVRPAVDIEADAKAQAAVAEAA